MITNNPVEPTDTLSTTYNTSHHVALPQVPTTENDTMTPRPPTVNSGETACVQAGERPAETQTINHTHIIYLKLRSFNAKDFKQSSDYILDMLCNTDILCISETWIMSHEMNLIRNIVDNRFPGMFTVCNKCGMSEFDSNYTIRLYGGVAVICGNISCLLFSDIDVDSECIIGIVVKDVNSNAIQVVLSLYMHFYCGPATQTDCFIETIDALQVNAG